MLNSVDYYVYYADVVKSRAITIDFETSTYVLSGSRGAASYKKRGQPEIIFAINIARFYGSKGSPPKRSLQPQKVEKIF